jgi:hypothetical protein
VSDPVKLTRPARCPLDSAPWTRCAGTKFRREGDYFICLTCHGTIRGRVARAVDLVAAKCGTCGETFLWKRRVQGEGETDAARPRAPSDCRACSLTWQAEDYERRAEALRDRAAKQRGQQRRAVARWKPPASASAAAAHKGERA